MNEDIFQRTYKLIQRVPYEVVSNLMNEDIFQHSSYKDVLLEDVSNLMNEDIFQQSKIITTRGIRTTVSNLMNEDIFQHTT